MSSPSAVVCREIFDENSLPSAEEISEYAQQLGIDTESESHLLPLARDGLMQALPPPWKAYYDEKLQTHYYCNEQTKKTQWEHPLDNVYKDLVKKARDASIHDDTCTSVQELLTFEENPKHLERIETKVDSDDEELTTDTDNHRPEIKDHTLASKRLTPLGRPPLAPLSRLDKKFADLKMSSLRRSVDSSFKPGLTRNVSDRDLFSRPALERPKLLFKQQSEIIDLKMHVLTSPEEENFSPLLGSTKGNKGLPLTGKGNMFLRLSKSDLPSPDTDKSYPLDSMTKSDPPKGILREKLSDSLQRKGDSLALGKPRFAASLEEDRKSVRFKLENVLEPTISPGSNSSSDQNDGQSSIISAPTTNPSPPIPSSPTIPHPYPLLAPITSHQVIPSMNQNILLAPIVTRPPIPPKLDTSKDVQEKKTLVTTPLSQTIVLSPITIKPSLPPGFDSPEEGKDINSLELNTSNLVIPALSQNQNILLSPIATKQPQPTRLENTEDEKEVDSLESDPSPRRRVIRPPAADYIKPDLFQKNFQKISDLVRPGDIEPSSVFLEPGDKEVRPRSPMIPQQKNKISINLMESIDSETSTDSPDKEFVKFDLNDLDDSVEIIKSNSERDADNVEKRSFQDDGSEKTTNSKISNAALSNKSPRQELSSPYISVPIIDLSSKQDLTSKQYLLPKNDMSFKQDSSPKQDKSPKLKSVQSESEDSKNYGKKNDEFNTFKPENFDTKPQYKLSMSSNSSTDIKSPRFDKPWSSAFAFKPLNKAVIAPLKSSDSGSSLGKNLSSPRLDGVILSQGKSSSDNVVVVYQFEQEEGIQTRVKSPQIPDKSKDNLERNKADERRRLELSMQKELESIRVEWTAKERKLRAELQQELKEIEEKFLEEKRVRLNEQAERHQREMEKALQSLENKHSEALQKLSDDFEEKRRRDAEAIQKRHDEDMARIKHECQANLVAKKEQLEIENERALSELRDQLRASLNAERTRVVEQNKKAIETLREDHLHRMTDLKHDYRAEVESLRTQHACHLEELRAKLSSERAARDPRIDRALLEKYKCLKEKYARLKHDVKMSIERRNKRREMSMTTGSETEKSNSHKQTQSQEKSNRMTCKELNETSVSAVIESEPRRNNNKYNDNETSQSESNAAKSTDNNNEDWKIRKDPTLISTMPAKRPHRRAAVAFREPPTRARSRNKDRDGAATTDCQDSSDATTADEKPKEPITSHGRRRCFTRLKSASTSRLNYSPKRGEGWSSPLESLRQQLRKLDDLEDQFPDLACQPAYSLRYPFAELGGVAVSRADSAELEFVRHRALVEREGMRRARLALKTRRAALREKKGASPHRAPSEEREATELEVALHRARALLGEKEIRLRHIERALRKLADSHPTPLIQEVTTSDESSASEEVGEAATGAVLRSLRALHADVRDIWRALDVRHNTASPETSSCNAPTTSQTRLTLSAPEPMVHDNSDNGVTERARSLRAWLQTAP